ncbi:MAG: dual specificity protein phosphatase family protein [Acidobacteriota bacterium]
MARFWREIRWLTLVALLCTTPGLASERPEAWAEAMPLAGAPNLHRVSATLYRSAQPSAEGMANLENLGVATVVNLRSFSSDRDELEGTGLAYEHIYMKAWHPERKEVVRFLRIVTNARRTPVLVHCKHGADRTGTMVALYRIVVEGWSKEEALKEMTTGGFGFHRIWSNLPRWIEKLDIEALRQELDLPSVAHP